MAIQWKNAEVKDRLLSAVLAAAGKVDMNEVARLFGQGATYDAVEGQLRKAKKQALKLTDEAAGRAGPATAASRSKKSKGSESPALTSVKGARITKFKKVTAPKIKTETRPGKNTLFKTTIENGVKDELEDQEEYDEEDEV